MGTNHVLHLYAPLCFLFDEKMSERERRDQYFSEKEGETQSYIVIFNFLQSFHTTLDFFATKKRIPGSKYCKGKQEKIFQMCDEKQQTHTSMALRFLERLHLCLSFSRLANKAKNLNKL